MDILWFSCAEGDWTFGEREGADGRGTAESERGGKAALPPRLLPPRLLPPRLLPCADRPACRAGPALGEEGEEEETEPGTGVEEEEERRRREVREVGRRR